MKLNIPKSGDQLLEMEYLDIRSHLLEVAAAFDRIERAGGSTDERLGKMRRLGQLAVDNEKHRAKRFLKTLSE